MPPSMTFRAILAPFALSMHFNPSSPVAKSLKCVEQVESSIHWGRRVKMMFWGVSVCALDAQAARVCRSAVRGAHRPCKREGRRPATDGGLKMPCPKNGSHAGEPSREGLESKK